VDRVDGTRCVSLECLLGIPDTFLILTVRSVTTTIFAHGTAEIYSTMAVLGECYHEVYEPAD